MKEKTDYLQLLLDRLISNFGVIMVFHFMPSRKNLTDSNEWRNYILNKIENYLSAEEKKGLILQQTKFVVDEEMNALCLNLFILQVAWKMVFILKTLFNNQEFVEGNPHDPNENPNDFFFYLFCQEGMENDYMTHRF